MLQQHLVTYDVNSPFHKAVKEKCTAQQPNGMYLFYDAIVGTDNVARRLPNTTLVGFFNSTDEARRTFVALAESVSPLVKVEKLFVCPAPDYYLSSDDRWTVRR